MTPERLREVGQALFGQWGWQTKMAQALGKKPRTVRRWVAGNTPVPESAAITLTLLSDNRKTPG